jgi:large subunit ribosomal protein L30
MAQIKITQTKSIIHTDKRQRANIEALGLRKINHSVIKEATPAILGIVRQVRHLVVVENL